MSMFIHDEYHIGRIAAFAVRQDSHCELDALRDALAAANPPVLAGNALELASSIAQTLGQANMDSAVARYGEDHGMHKGTNGAGAEASAAFLANCREESQMPWLSEHSNIDMLHACRSLAANCCDDPAWRDSTACAILTIIEDAAILRITATANGRALRRPAILEGSTHVLLSNL